jgi:DNA repair protein RadC
VREVRGAPAYSPTIKEMPAQERPRERLLSYGAGVLSTSELLAIILRTGTSSENVTRLAEHLLLQYGGLAGLARASAADLCQVHGIGGAKVTQIKAALELGRRLREEQPEERPQISSPLDVCNLLLLEMSPLEQEHLRVLLLDTRNRVMGRPVEVYKGTVNSSQIRVAEVFKEAVRQNCSSIVVVHNHPSGDPSPSPEDVRVTETIVEAGKLLDIEVLDHIVLAGRSHVSLRERKLGFRKK